MWKKEDEQTAQPRAEDAPRVSSPGPTTQGAGRATIGPSITIRGEVTGSEDLLIHGKIDGSVTLDEHSVGVGREGRVNADIIGRLITIEGHVEGDLTAQEQIVLRGSAQVKGDIKAPRVVLEDGATFRGLVDMGTAKAKSSDTDSKSASSPSAQTVSTSSGGAGGGKSEGSTARSSVGSDSRPPGGPKSSDKASA